MAPFDHDYYDTLVRSHYGRIVHYFEETTSTMDEARAGADERGAASHGLAYVAGRQMAGRGRQGREWVSEPGDGLYVTYHIIPHAHHTATLFSVGGAMAVADAVHEVSGLDVALKWPNDVLHDGRKLAGVLAEARHGQHIDVFLGIGINVRTSALPPEVRSIATSIEDAGASAPRIEDLLASLSRALEIRIAAAEGHPGTLLDEWKARLGTLGHRVRLASPDGQTHEGKAVDVTSDGDLMIRHDDGTTQTYAAGDVTTV